MESFNRIELVGIVGNVRKETEGDVSFLRFNVATNHAFKNADGEVSVETTWFTVVTPVCSKKNARWLDTEREGGGGLKAGDRVRVVGRMRHASLADSNEYGCVIWYVVASNVELLNN